ncbi:hypothetical protein QBC37DRAFT_480376 [Rhypophila decipiens]|uniref:Uncharacterized protein n=1 Tax=Rhypophila decipiens TaxID=261697 RepID=A0AAN6YCQ4_9PEZI|nr:hypothetical protein QBC37DRAFT_480376 [Rhypophila decipiens]
MISNSTRAAHNTRSSGHGHERRLSFASNIRRKGSALVSLSALFRKFKSNHQHSTNTDTLPTDPTEERPSVFHLEDASPPPCESWSDGRDDSSSRHRKRQFWTVSGAGPRARDRSTDIEYTPRLSRARSFVQSLRKRESVLLEEDYATSPFLDMQPLPPPECGARDLRLGLHDPSQDTVDMTISPLNLAYGYLCDDVQTWKNSNRASSEQIAAWDQKLEQLRALIDSLAETLPPTQDVAGIWAGETCGSEQGGASMDVNSGSADWNTSECTTITEVVPGPPATPVAAFEYLGGLGEEGWWECAQVLEAHACQQDQQSIRTVIRSPHRSLEDELLQVGASFDGDGNMGDVPGESMLTV